ncbi:MAG: cytochrome b/b6 domain-containing protein [Pseudomonadota bacterium]
MKSNPELIHPAWLRLTHWVNVIAVFMLVTSGWRIYNASPIFDFAFPPAITLGGWLGGALLWHFFAMWILLANGLLYLSLNIVFGRLKRKFFPLSPRQILQDFLAVFKGQLAHDDLRYYNAPQKLAYLFIIVDIAVLIMSGLVIWKPVQFPLLRELMGDYDNARIVHFVAMASLLAVVLVHIAMVALVPRTFMLMIRGR